MKVNEKGYIVRQKKRTYYRGISRDWFMVKHNANSIVGIVHIKDVLFPKKYIGKKVRFKVEMVKK